MTTLKIRLKELRTARDLTQGELAHRMCVDRTYINKIERGCRKPGIQLTSRLLEELHCQFEDLIQWEHSS